MDESTKKLKQYLKKTRSDKKLTVQSVADELGKSKSYISQIESINENVSRAIPGIEFLYDYIGVVSSSTDEYEYHIDHINELTGWGLEADVHYGNIQEFFGRSTHSPKMHISLDEETKRLKNQLYDFRISDINYHLTDKKNHAFYKSYKLTPEDKVAIDKMIQAYLIGNFENLIGASVSLVSDSDISEEKYKKMTDYFEQQIEDIKN